MPFAPYIRATALCEVLVSGVPTEIAQYGVSLDQGLAAVSTADPSDQAKRLMDDTAADFRTFHTSVAMGIAAEVVLKEVKFAKINALGKYEEEPYIAPVALGAGAGGGSRLPIQSTMVVSLTTDRRGATGRGRFYVPGVTFSIGDNWAYNAGNLPAARQAAADLINAINNRPGVDAGFPSWEVVVASSKGYLSKVTGVRVGNLPDTQRRRKNGLTETYNAPLPVA